MSGSGGQQSVVAKEPPAAEKSWKPEKINENQWIWVNQVTEARQTQTPPGYEADKWVKQRSTQYNTDYWFNVYSKQRMWCGHLPPELEAQISAHLSRVQPQVSRQQEGRLRSSGSSRESLHYQLQQDSHQQSERLRASGPSRESLHYQRQQILHQQGGLRSSGSSRESLHYQQQQVPPQHEGGLRSSGSSRESLHRHHQQQEPEDQRRYGREEQYYQEQYNQPSGHHSRRSSNTREDAYPPTASSSSRGVLTSTQRHEDRERKALTRKHGYDFDLTPKPDPGREGRRIRICVNFFPIIMDEASDKMLHRYQVLITPEVTSRAVRKRLFKELVEKFPDDFLGTAGCPFYDGQSLAFSDLRMRLNGEGGQTDVGTYKVGPDGSGRRTRKEYTFKLIREKNDNLRLQILLDVFRTRQPNPLIPQLLQALNIGFNSFVGSRPHVIEAQRGLYPLTAQENYQSLEGGLRARDGFKTAVKIGPNGVFWNVNTVVAAFYAEGEYLVRKKRKVCVSSNLGPIDHDGILETSEASVELIEFIEELLGTKAKYIVWDDRNKRKVTKELKNVQIFNLKMKRKEPQKHRFLSLSSKTARTGTFTIKQGNGEQRRITVEEYFEETYNMRLNFPDWPVVMVGSETMLPIEVCKIAPSQKYNKPLNPKQTEKMIKFANVSPHIRFSTIKNGVSNTLLPPSAEEVFCGMSVGRDYLTIPARILQPPEVKYGGDRFADVENGALEKGSWNLKGRRFFLPVTITHWSILDFAHLTDYDLTKFVSTLVDVMKKHGITVMDPQPKFIRSTSRADGDTPAELKRDLLRAFGAAVGDEIGRPQDEKDQPTRPDVVVCVLANEDSRFYNLLKATAEIGVGVMTQCVQMKKAQGANAQYCSNVVAKINVKCGGTNQVITRQHELKWLWDESTIIFGADLTHSAPGDRKPSIAAVVASYDEHFTRYMRRIRAQRPRENNRGPQDLIEDLEPMVYELLAEYFSRTGKKPKQILFYRDGVSEGQFSNVLDTEVAAIKDACARLDPEYNPKLTFVCVQKRHQTRLMDPNVRAQGERQFQQQQQQRGGREGARNEKPIGNALPGTVVDTDIVHPWIFDFYLNSHAAIQGTSRPAHYSVLFDENKFDSDTLQFITFALCFNYGRATKAISYVPAVRYAHLVAERASAYLSAAMDGDDESSVHSGSAATDNTAMFEAAQTVVGSLRPWVNDMMYC
ncbi:hypothetical protein HK102_013731 [Quaeritorhiza haematococci]|nr:hypothetical protein HK102_013731 [Quaeritorhiza haematococci]